METVCADGDDSCAGVGVEPRYRERGTGLIVCRGDDGQFTVTAIYDENGRNSKELWPPAQTEQKV